MAVWRTATGRRCRPKEFTDYLLRVVVPDIRAFDSVYQRLIRGTKLSDISSSFAMAQIKFTTALPLDYA